MKQIIGSKMLEVMSNSETKELGLTMKLELTDGSIRKGVYTDITVNPLKDPMFKDVTFVVLISNKPTPDTKIYVPLHLIATIEWVG